MENALMNQGVRRRGMGAKARRRTAIGIRYAVNTVLGVVFLSPLLFMFLTAFNPIQALSSQISSVGEFFPKSVTINNFVQVFEKIALGRYLLNTLFYAVVTVALVIVVNSLAGYALAKIPFRGSRALLNIIVIMIVIPFEGITLSLYMVVSKLKLLNTPFAVILPSAMSCFYIFMFRQFFDGIPNAVIEAAEIDGCPPLVVFFRVVVPMAVPVFVTVLILEFFGKWSDYYWPMLTLTKRELWNIQIAITDFNSRADHYGQFMAALTVCTLPIVVLFLCLQKYYIQGISTQGIKG